MKTIHRSTIHALGGLAACAFFASPASAQTGAGPCFPTSPIADWAAHDVGLALGASAPTTAGDLRLCGDGAGYGPEDALRTVSQEITDDFDLSALVTLVDEGNEGGLEARTIVRVADAPRVRITASRAAGSVWLSAEARNGATLVAATPVPVSLPVFVRLSRTGGLFEASWSNGGTYLPLLAYDASGTALATSALSVSAAQGAPLGAPGEVQLAQVQLTDTPLPPDAVCTVPSVTPSGADILIDGARLAQVTSVRIAGEYAQITSQSDARLVLSAARPSAAFASGAVVLETASGERAAGGRIAYNGAPFVRGDVDENGVVDNDDVAALSARLAGTGDVDCVAAADVDGDGDIDSGDLSRLKGFLRTGKKPPVAPFPAPGYSSFPAPACGLGAAPTVASIADSSGAPLGSRTTLVEGDVIEVHGTNLPTSSNVEFYFGDARTTRLPGGSATLVRLRVGTVYSSGEKCPRLLESTDSDATASARFGLVREVRADTLARHVCAQFAASSNVVGSFQWNASANEGFLPVPASVIDPALGANVDLLLVRPAVTGGPDRGSRRVSASGRATDSAQSYASMLEDLAKNLTLQLDGGAPNGCRVSDFEAVPDPIAGGLFVRPTNTSPGGLPPPPPPHTTQIAPMKPPLDAGTAGGIALAKPSCNDPNVNPDTRLGAWCAFVEATAIQSDGVPAWEDSVPQSALYDSWNEIANLPHPDDRSVSDKRTMYSFETRATLESKGYLDPCAVAARAAYCTGGKSDWMPGFPEGARVYKGFWRKYADLPASVDEHTLYSYDPPDGPRQYLVGLHLAFGTNQVITYWRWATFWIPRGTDTLTKGGQPLQNQYNPTCTTGSFQDQPQEVSGVWKNFVMCVNGENGGTPCGNPWGPQDECKLEGCRTCHSKVKIELPTSIGELSTAWMGTWTRHADVTACYDEIAAGLANNQAPYENLTPPECQ